MGTASPSELLRRHFRTFADGGVDDAAPLWHPEIEWQPLDASGGPVRGREAMRRYYAEWVETMEDLRGEVEIVLERDAVVAALIRNSGRGRVSGVPAAGAYYVVCEVRGGQIVAAREFVSRDEAIAAAEALC